jgi:hypothetical protein
MKQLGWLLCISVWAVSSCGAGVDDEAPQAKSQPLDTIHVDTQALVTSGTGVLLRRPAPTLEPYFVAYSVPVVPGVALQPWWGSEIGFAVPAPSDTTPEGDIVIDTRVVGANGVDLGGRYLVSPRRPETVTVSGSPVLVVPFVIPPNSFGGAATLLTNGQPSTNTALLSLTVPLVFNTITSMAYLPSYGSTRYNQLLVADSTGVYDVDFLQVQPTQTLRLAGKHYLTEPVGACACVYAVPAGVGKPDIIKIPIDPSLSPSVYVTTSASPRDIDAIGAGVDLFNGDIYIADRGGDMVRVSAFGDVTDQVQGPVPEVFREPVGMASASNGIPLSYLAQGATSGTTVLKQLLSPGAAVLSEFNSVQLSLQRDEVYGDRVTAAPAPVRKFVYQRQAPFVRGAAEVDSTRNQIQLWEDTIFKVGTGLSQRVLVSNEAKNDIDYPYPDGSAQTQSAVMPVPVSGPQGKTLYFRLWDAPDTAPTELPNSAYQASDNRVPVASSTSFGLALTATAAEWQSCLPVAFDSTGQGTVFLKVAGGQSGDNYRVVATKQNCSVSPNRIEFVSPLYTAWKRVFLEVDSMFRRGGFLAAAALAGTDEVVVAATPLLDGGSLRADGIQVGERVAIFDVNSPFEGEHDEACVATASEGFNEADAGIINAVRLRLQQCDGSAFALSRSYTASVVGGRYDFTTGEMAAVGVVSRIPDGGVLKSSFFQADVRNLQQPYDDGFVEFFAVDTGAGAVPYLPSQWFEDNLAAVLKTPRTSNAYDDFSRRWFTNYSIGDRKLPGEGATRGVFHLVGVSAAGQDLLGLATADGPNWSYVYAASIEQVVPPSTNPAEAARVSQNVTAHEIGHLFKLNPSAMGGGVGGSHDLRPAWCDNANACGHAHIRDAGTSYPCLMRPTVFPLFPVDHFCRDDLKLGDPNAGLDDAGLRLGSIRGTQNPP